MTAAAALLGAGTGLAVGGRVFSALQARRLGRYNARVEDVQAQQEALNLENEAVQEERLATMLDDEIAFVRDVEAFELDRIDEALDRQEGQTIAIIGASGLDFSGSPLAVLEENARQGQIEKLALQFRANLKVRALTEEQVQRRRAAELTRFGAGQRLRIGRQRSGLARFVGEQEFVSGLIGAGGAALQGAGRFAAGSSE